MAMKLTRQQREKLLELIKEKPKNMRNFCDHYGITIVEAQKIARLATVKELKKMYDDKN